MGGPQERRIVASLGRAELEDRHVSLLEENHVRGNVLYMFSDFLMCILCYLCGSY